MIVMIRFLPYVVFIVLILSVGWWGYSLGVDDTVQRYEVKIQEERKRQQSANEAALEHAKESEAELRRLLSERNATIRILMQDAQADPNADRPSVSSDGVRRINRVN
jgi:Tfp pilus assembly protein PilO